MKLSYAAPLALVSMAGLSGCSLGPPATATIAYSQVGACSGYTSGSGATLPRPNTAYIVFKIQSIDNTRSHVDLEFVPVRLYVDQSKEKAIFEETLTFDRRYVSGDNRFTRGLGLTGPTQKVIPAGSKIDINAFAVVEVTTATANGAEEAHHTAYSLSYDPDMGEVEFFAAPPKILLTESNAAERAWPQTEDCRALELVS
jgi:hypothetical protein